MSDIEELLKKHTDNVDKALAGFEGKVGSIADAVAALQKQADSAEAKSNRLALSGGYAPQATDTKELRISDEERKYMGAVLKGQTPQPLESKSTTSQVAVEADGGILVPEIMRGQMEILIKKQSPIRRVARVVPLGANEKFPISTGATDAGWVGENDTRDATAVPHFAGMQPSGGTLYALPGATEEVIDDCILNLESFISDSVIDVMAEKESIAFLNGDGVKKPDGFLIAPKAATADATRALGTLQYIPTGAAAAFASTNPADVLVAMIFSVKAGYRQAPGCAWLASTDAIATIAKFKDGQGNYLYTPSLVEGVPSMLLGYPVIECEHMASIGADAYPLAFGNWQRGYLIGDRTPLNVLRDPYTTKGLVKWYFRRRVYGGVLNSEAIKVLKVAVS